MRIKKVLAWFIGLSLGIPIGSPVIYAVYSFNYPISVGPDRFGQKHAINAGFGEQTAYLNQTPIPETPIIELIRKKAKENGLNVNTMIRLAKCESGLRQFSPHGAVLRGIEHPLDIGIYQINSLVWLESAELIGYDIFTSEGNIDMAMYIAKYHGYTQWVCAKMI